MISYMSTEYLRTGALVGDTIRMLRTRFFPFILVAGVVLVPIALLNATLGRVAGTDGGRRAR